MDSTNANVSFKLPINATTGKEYQGTNILLLWMSAEKNSYSTNEYATFKQWAEKKEFVRKDEKGSKIIKFDVLEKENDKGETDKIPYLKVYTVFNSSQLNSYKAGEIMQEEPAPLFERIKHADDFIKNTGAVIKYGSDKAFYR